MTIKHLYPTQRPSLDLNFARTKRLDPRVDFERFSVGTYVGNDGLIKTAVDHEPRFDHDPVTGESLGLLVEEERVNSLRYSQDFTNALWVKTSATIIANSVIAPDGTLTGSTMKANAGTAILPSVIQNAGDAAIRTLSLYAKMGTYRYLKINPRGHQYALVVDLQDGSVYATGNTNVISADIIPAPNGWYRLILTTDNTSSTRTFGIRFSTNANNNATFDFDGTETVHIWGAQLETGNFPTSYIPTEASSVTRAADVASITGSNFSSWYNQDEGTFYSKGDLTYSYSGSNTFRSILVGGTFPSRRWSWAMVEANNKLSSATDGMSHGSFYTNMSSNIPNNFNIAQAIKNTATTNVSSAADGVIKGSLTGFSSYTISSILIGHNSFTGHISRLTYYPTRLSDTILQNLTL